MKRYRPLADFEPAKVKPGDKRRITLGKGPRGGVVIVFRSWRYPAATAAMRSWRTRKRKAATR